MRPRPRPVLAVQLLESRLAPAVQVDPVDVRKATYTDVDGDAVTIRVSAGDLNQAIFGTAASGVGDQLQTMNLTNNGFDGANLTVSVVRAATGDGRANIGYINATGRDLGAVKVPGDLGAIDAGDGTTAGDPGLKSLAVLSLGDHGTSTGVPDLISDILGPLGALTVTGDVVLAYVHVTGGANGVDGTVGSVSVGGTLYGGVDSHTGLIEATGDIGPVTVRRDIRGGDGDASGTVQSDRGKIKSVSVGGSLFGGNGQVSGQIRSGSHMGPVTIGGSVFGGFGNSSGIIASDTGFGVDSGNIASVTIRGALVGGPGNVSGMIRSSANMGPVSIGSSVIGSIGDESGKILSAGALTSLTVGGSVVGGYGSYRTNLAQAGQIWAGGRIGSISIRGSVVGEEDPDLLDAISVGDYGGSIVSPTGVGMVRIGGSLVGKGNNTGFINVATLGGLALGGSIIGGSGLRAGSVNADILGPVTIGGDLTKGSGGGAGTISDSNRLPSLTVRGSVSGIVSGGDAGPIRIGQDLLGTGEDTSGVIQMTGTIASVTIGGSMAARTFGGIESVVNMAVIESGGDMGPISIGRDLIGGSAIESANVARTGLIESGGRIASVTVGGSVVAGWDNSQYDLTLSGWITAAKDIGSLTVRGSIVGSYTNPVLIAARGQATATATRDLAIGSITVGGNVVRTRFLAGYLTSRFGAIDPKNADAQVGPVAVKGDWIASSLVAGAMSPDPTNTGIGDQKISGAGVKDVDDATLKSRIASVTIGGILLGTPGFADHFGFVAQQVGSFRVGGIAVPLTAGVDVIGVAADVTLREV